jgi:hypothetical protein
MSIFQIFHGGSNVLSPVGGGSNNSYYVATSGSSTNSGAIGSPWDLQTALHGGYPSNTVQPGDTIYIRSGTYTRPQTNSGTFDVTLSGTAAFPIKIKAYPAESVIFNAGSGNANYIPAVFSLDAGQYYWFQGPRFEITGTSNFKRHSAYDGQDYSIDVLAAGGFVIHGGSHAKGVKLINLVIHDTMGSIGAFAQFEDIEIYGCLMYFDGADGATDRGHGHAIYSANDISSYPGTYHTIKENIIHNCFSDGLNIYGTTARIDNHYVEGNVVFAGGAPSSLGWARNLTLASGGGAAQAAVSGITVKDNYTYHKPSGPGMTSPNMFQSVAAYDQASFDGLQVTGNKFRAGDSAGCWFSGVQTNLTLTGNSFLTAMTHDSDNTITAGNYPSNTQNSSTPTTNEIYVRPNAYESKRGHVVIYNWENLSSVSVDLSSILSNGDSYTIKSAENYFGTAIASGTYTGGTISIPMSTGHTLASLVGTNIPTPYALFGTCAPQFAALIVEGTEGTGNFYYAATSGSTTGAGTIGDPWTLQKAFDGGYPTNTIQPGDTVYVRGGTYTGSFNITRSGSSGSKIIFKAYNRERAKIDCNGGNPSTGNILTAQAHHVRLQEIEIVDSNWIANYAPGGFGGNDSGGPWAGVEVINCVIHDVGGSAFNAYTGGLNGLTAYGNIVYFPGGTQGVNGQAYCTYVQNLSTQDIKLFENNAFLFQWGTYPIHVYTQGAEIQRIQYKKNATLVAGDLKGSGRNWNFMGSASTVLKDIVFDENCVFGDAFADTTDQGLLDLGVDGSTSPYDALENVAVTNNYMGVGTIAMSESSQRTNVTMTSNTIWGSAYVGWTYGAGGTFPSNTYHSSRPGSNWTKIYPNTYEPGRAMLVCFNWANAGSQNFDFSSFLSNGDTYEVRDAFNFYGSTITTGTYSGGNVSITLSSSPTISTALKVPTGYSQPVHPAPDYYVFIVRKT